MGFAEARSRSARGIVGRFGEPLQVTPLDGSEAFEVRAAVIDAALLEALGAARGHLAAPALHCLPDTAARLADGDVLTRANGEAYALVEALPPIGELVELRVVAR